MHQESLYRPGMAKSRRKKGKGDHQISKTQGGKKKKKEVEKFDRNVSTRGSSPVFGNILIKKKSARKVRGHKKEV